jgi:hypothetical protein
MSMQAASLFLVSFLISLGMKGQGILTDTLPTSVNLTGFSPGKKVVKAEYGKVIMYFSQKDYLGKITDKDTVRITPKYFDDYTISKLLKRGRVKIFRRSTSSFQDSIRHRIKQYGSTADREFEFTDGTHFFMNLEVVGIMGAIYFSQPDLLNPQKKEIIIPKKEFEYDEEFAETNDTTSIKIRDYFPIKSKGYYVYDPNNSYGETDTNQCRTEILRGQDIFYFADCYAKFGIASIGTEMFGKGIYFYRNDSLFTIEADYEKDIHEKELKDALLLLPSYMKPGDSVTLNSSQLNKKVITYLFKDNLETKGKVYKDCIKIKIISYWDSGTIYLSYVWLKKDIGMIKWMRETGRIDEFINFFYKN